MRRSDMYSVYYSQGLGFVAGPRFRSRTDAVRYARQRRDSASFAVQTPEGDWHRFSPTGRAILPRRSRI